MKTNVLIIGGGLAGRMAACETLSAGLDTVVVQDGRGASPWVHGFNAPVVREGDSADVFFDDTLKSGQGLSDPALAHTLCYDAESNFRDLLSMGLPFNRKGDEFQALRPLGASFPRVVSIGNETGTAILNKLDELYGSRWHDLAHCRALRLEKKADRVCGALIYNTREERFFTVEADAVVLACGGYCGIFPVSTNKRDSGGDGIGMAYEAGAPLCDMEFIQFEPSAAMWPPALKGTGMITTLLFDGAVLRNKNGERFMLKYGPEGDHVNKDVMARRIAAEVAEGNGTEHGGIYMDVTGVGREKLSADYAMYLKRYEDVGIDLCTEWIELGPAPHTSLGGVRADENGGTPVPGLFVCGEVLGGLHGANRIGGSAGLETLVFGRRAGKAAAAYAAANPIDASAEPLPEFGTENITDRLESLRGAMKDALASGLSPLRDGNTLAASVRVFEDALAETDRLAGSNPVEEFLRLRLHNDLTAALLTATAALNREHSLGCHTRSDDNGADQGTFRILLEKKNGSLQLTKERIEA